MAQQKKKQPTEAKAVAIIAGALAIGASAQATANTLSPILGIPVPSLLPILLIAMSKPMTYGIATLPSATAAAESAGLEATYRAHFVYAASARLKGLSGVMLQEALGRERVYFNQHINAMQNRKSAAIAVDQAARRYGDQLGWYAKMDSLTSEECREANGRNFSASVVPPIGYPGAVHPSCRCRAGKPYSTSKTVYTVKPLTKKVV